MKKAALIRTFQGRILRAIAHLHKALSDCGNRPLIMESPRYSKGSEQWKLDTETGKWKLDWKAVLPPTHRAVRRNPTFTTAEWSGELTLPISIDTALAFVEKYQSELAKYMADEVKSAATVLITEKYHTAVLARDRVCLEWPWPDVVSPQNATNAQIAGWLLQTLLAHTCAQLEGEPSWFPGLSLLPDDAAPGLVRSWAKERILAYLNNLEDSPEVAEAKDVLKDKTEVEDFMDRAEKIRRAVDGAVAGTAVSTLAGVGFVLQGKQWHLPAAGMALLYLAELDVVARLKELTPKGPSGLLVDVSPVPIKTMSSLAGADPGTLQNGASARFPDESSPSSMTFTWPGKIQLDLFQPLPGASALVAVGQQYGNAAIRDMLAVYLFTWAARASANEAFWWWPDEHLETAGLSDNKDARARLRRVLDDLGRATLTAQYRKGKPLTGPVLSTLETDGTARLLRLHSSLYRGVCGEEGKIGRYFWPIPMELLRLPADGTTGKIHLLAPVLGSLFRAAMSGSKDRDPTAIIGAGRLADYLGMGRETDRLKQRLAATQLRTGLDQAQQTKLIEGWTIRRGDLDNLTAVLVLTPTTQQLVSAPAWIPSTGDELSYWMLDLGLNTTQTAELLGAKADTIQKWAKRFRGRPLPTAARRALRRYLWRM